MNESWLDATAVICNGFDALVQVAQHIRSLMDHMETGSSTVPVPQQQQQQQQQKQQEREEEQQQHQERYSQGAHGDAFAPSRSKPLVSGLSARDAAIAVQKQDAAGISAQIRRVGRRLFEALDYLDNDRFACVMWRSFSSCVCITLLPHAFASGRGSCL